MYDPTLYPIIIIPVIDANGKRSVFAGFGKEPHLSIAPRFEDLPPLGARAAEMLMVAIAGGRVPIPTTRRARQGNGATKFGRITGRAPVTGRTPVAAPVAVEQPNLTPKGRKERQKLLEKKLKERKR